MVDVKCSTCGKEYALRLDATLDAPSRTSCTRCWILATPDIQCAPEHLDQMIEDTERWEAANRERFELFQGPLQQAP